MLCFKGEHTPNIYGPTGDQEGKCEGKLRLPLYNITALGGAARPARALSSESLTYSFLG